MLDDAFPGAWAAGDPRDLDRAGFAYLLPNEAIEIETRHGAAIPAFTPEQVRRLAAESDTYRAARPGAATDSVHVDADETVWVATRDHGAVECRPDADGRYPIRLAWTFTSAPAARPASASPDTPRPLPPSHPPRTPRAAPSPGYRHSAS